MSVCYQGFISRPSTSHVSDSCEFEEDARELDWRGTWDFTTKDKKTPMNFHYTWKSLSIPLPLVNYVSFASVDGTANRKSRGRGRGSSRVVASERTTVATDHAYPPESASFLEVKRVHQLMGLWEGSFEIVASPGESPIVVPESFFFHAYLGGGGSVTMLSDRCNDASSAGGSLDQLSHESYGPSDGIALAEALNDTSRVPQQRVSSRSLDALLPPEPSFSCTFLRREDTLELMRHVRDAADSGDAGALVALVGFGMNQFGRFSLIAIFNDTTGEVISEKRYMLSKFGNIKKMRPSFSLSELAVRALEESIEIIKPPEVAPSTADDIDGMLPSKRKRVNSMKVKDSFITEEAESRIFPVPSVSGSKSNGSKIKSADNNVFGKTERKAKSSSKASVIDTIITDYDNDDENYKSAVISDETGEIYEGGWYYGQRHGEGVCLYNDGTIYEGNWVLGRESGQGQLLTANRELIYRGDWTDGLINGYGTYRFLNGDTYTGDFKEGVRHGKGDYIMSSGCSYIGEWRDNKRCGKGVFQWPDGSYYEGEWENDARHGRGNLVLANGFRYEGTWARNLMEGKGTAVFPDSQVYQGSFRHGLRDGRGSITFSEGGAVYEGRFKEDRIDGQGTIKLEKSAPGPLEDEIFIPIQIQADIKRIHLKAGFGNSESH